MNAESEPLPTVSVLMSTFNRAASLATAIDSVLEQRDVHLELIVIDDASSDTTPQILQGWQNDDRVRVYQNPENLGLPATLNRAIELARAPFLARIDDDDQWTDSLKLARQLKWMHVHPETVIVGTAYIDEWGRESCNPLEDHDIRVQMLMRCPFCHSSVVLRGDAVIEAGAYDPSLPYAEDWDLWLRLGQQGEMRNLASVTLIKNQGEDTLSQRFFLRQLATASAFSKRYSSAYPGAVKARLFHGFTGTFFRIFPVDGRIHKLMGRLFRQRFGLEEKPLKTDAGDA